MSTDDDDLSAQIRGNATRHVAPDPLRAGIRTQVALEDARRVPGQAARAATPGWFRVRRTGLLTGFAGFALGMLCMALLLPLAQRLSPGEAVDAELVGVHVRALQSGRIVEVPSSDRHTVKPWFQGRLDFAPPVFDLAADGFTLSGGRIEHVQGRAVATLAYAHKRHVVDLFIWPGGAAAAPVVSLRRGFTLVQWDDGAMQYGLVSDMDRDSAETFVRLWQARAAAQ